jgi:lipoate-protein ligase A
MLIIKNFETDPYFNLASEEYLIRHFSDDIFMLWRNQPAIVVGKHQNTLSEINYGYVKDNNIKVVRRLSGGGAVFHDLGNLNFTFIMNGHSGQLVDFRKYTQPILDVLLTLGINAEFSGRNDLLIDGKKFSGNAEHVYKNRILHHGTLLFSSEMTDLSQALNVNQLKFRDKAVKSVRSRVTNISEHLHQSLSVTEFYDLIVNHISEMYSDSQPYQFSLSDIEEINKLVINKYSSWDWNFGYSPNYNFSRTFHASGGNIEFFLNVEQSIIMEARIFGDYFFVKPTEDIEQALKGIRHEKEAIEAALSSFDIAEYFTGCRLVEIVTGLF